MLLTADHHARIAARLRAKAAQVGLPPFERDRLLESAERFEALSARVRVIEQTRTPKQTE
jgi:hypothetical protein